jgi:hypothetical protein
VRPGRPRGARGVARGVARGEARGEARGARGEARGEARGARGEALPTAPPPPPAAEREEWVPLRVSASHAYVRGLRVSGTIHRAVVRLVRET